MIYTKDECDLLKDTIERKQIERSVYGSIEAFPPSFRSAMECQMDLDIMKCEAM